MIDNFEASVFEDSPSNASSEQQLAETFCAATAGAELRAAAAHPSPQSLPLLSGAAVTRRPGFSTPLQHATLLGEGGRTHKEVLQTDGSPPEAALGRHGFWPRLSLRMGILGQSSSIASPGADSYEFSSLLNRGEGGWATREGAQPPSAEAAREAAGPLTDVVVHP